jgi:hypothetical protein
MGACFQRKVHMSTLGSPQEWGLWRQHVQSSFAGNAVFRGSMHTSCIQTIQNRNRRSWIWTLIIDIESGASFSRRRPACSSARLTLICAFELNCSHRLSQRAQRHCCYRSGQIRSLYLPGRISTSITNTLSTRYATALNLSRTI